MCSSRFARNTSAGPKSGFARIAASAQSNAGWSCSCSIPAGISHSTAVLRLRVVDGRGVSWPLWSGSIEAFNINLLQQKGSLFCTRPTLNTYAAKREDLLSIANNLFNVVASGKVKIPVNQKYALKDAQQAHRDLEARKTTGSTVLMP